ncbi:SNF2 family N-terminal domain-containing protein [Aureimonas phyllosphaerae]|nr:SNF2 family N-terminal domain-containing protein [Aureimonas phyllosphaerae]
MRTYGALARLGERQWVVERAEPHVVMKLKRVFPKVATTATPPIALYGADDLAADLLWFMERYPLQISPEDREALEHGRARLFQDQAQIDAILLPDWQPTRPISFREGRTPYPYQARAAEIAHKRGRLLLLDDVGLGKTISALAAVANKRRLPAAIVVQAHLATQWAKEYVEKFTTLTAHIIKGTKPYSLPPADIYIFRYSNIAGWTDIAARGTFASVVYDEVQELRKGVQTQKGRAAEVFTDSTGMAMGLTATPIYNYGSEIYDVLRFIAPGELGSFDEFCREWCRWTGKHWIVNNPDALGTYLLETGLTLRRTEHDVETDLPPVSTILRSVDTDERIVESAHAEARALALRVTTGDFMQRGQAARELDMFARRITGLSKARSVAAMVRMIVESGEPVLLAGWHRDVYDIWMDVLADLKPVLYTGTESQSQKDKAKATFMEGRTNLMIISLRSGAGLDGLQHRCATVVFGEFDWSPQVHKQVVGRVRRPGQRRPVEAIYLQSEDGSDPLIIETLGLKSSQSRGILDPMKGAEHIHTDDSRLQKLAAQYLEKADERQN